MSDITEKKMYGWSDKELNEKDLEKDLEELQDVKALRDSENSEVLELQDDLEMQEPVNETTLNQYTLGILTVMCQISLYAIHTERLENLIEDLLEPLGESFYTVVPSLLWVAAIAMGSVTAQCLQLKMRRFRTSVVKCCGVVNTIVFLVLTFSENPYVSIAGTCVFAANTGFYMYTVHDWVVKGFKHNRKWLVDIVAAAIMVCSIVGTGGFNLDFSVPLFVGSLLGTLLKENY